MLHSFFLPNESQDKIHYAMPQKVMLYDGMDYEEQIRNLWKQRMECQKQARRIGKPLEHLTAAEYLSRFRKNDRLIPIISLVFYYGSDPWDGTRIFMICFDWKEAKRKRSFREIFTKL